jgi:hypothetical protein
LAANLPCPILVQEKTLTTYVNIISGQSSDHSPDVGGGGINKMLSFCPQLAKLVAQDFTSTATVTASRHIILYLLQKPPMGNLLRKYGYPEQNLLSRNILMSSADTTGRPPISKQAAVAVMFAQVVGRGGGRGKKNFSFFGNAL